MRDSYLLVYVHQLLMSFFLLRSSCKRKRTKEKKDRLFVKEKSPEFALGKSNLDGSKPETNPTFHILCDQMQPRGEED